MKMYGMGSSLSFCCTFCGALLLPFFLCHGWLVEAFTRSFCSIADTAACQHCNGWEICSNLLCHMRTEGVQVNAVLAANVQ